MAKVVSSLTSALPSRILPRVMGLASPEDRMTLWRIQLGRADMWDDTTLAII